MLFHFIECFKLNYLNFWPIDHFRVCALRFIRLKVATKTLNQKCLASIAVTPSSCRPADIETFCWCCSFSAEDGTVTARGDACIMNDRARPPTSQKRKTKENNRRRMCLSYSCSAVCPLLVWETVFDRNSGCVCCLKWEMGLKTHTLSFGEHRKPREKRRKCWYIFAVMLARQCQAARQSFSMFSTLKTAEKKIQKTALLMYVADRQTSVRRLKKGNEWIEEGSGHGADCLLTSPQGKIPCQTQTRLPIAAEHVAYHHPTMFLSWRVYKAILYLRTYKHFCQIKHISSIFQTLITWYHDMKEIISNPRLGVDPGITCPLFTHTHCKAQGYMYVSHAAFVSSPGSNVHWNKCLHLTMTSDRCVCLSPISQWHILATCLVNFQRISL